MEKAILIKPTQSTDDIVQMYGKYIWAIVHASVTRTNLVSDEEDLFQVGVLALIGALRYSKKHSYLKAAIRNAIFYQANRFHGCFTISRNVASMVSACRRSPEEYSMSDPIFKLTFHGVEGYA